MDNKGPLKKRLIKLNSKWAFIQKAFGNKAFTLLDIGSGNHSPSKTKLAFPQCRYYGVDLARDYSYSEEDFKEMEEFFEMDLTKLEFEKLQDNFFDAIWMVHVIEHLYNGDEVIEKLLPKLKKGGFIYIEYPGKKSERLPSMEGTLNFYDDSTHVRIYSVPELKALLKKNGVKVLTSGTRRNIYFIMAMPFRVAGAWIRRKKLTGNMFWDVLGFAEYVFAQKES